MTEGNKPKTSASPEPSTNPIIQPQIEKNSVSGWIKKNDAISALIVTILIAAVGATWLIRSELSNVRIEIIDNISTIAVDIAVLKTEVTHIKEDIVEIKDAIKPDQVNENNKAIYLLHNY